METNNNIYANRASLFTITVFSTLSLNVQAESPEIMCQKDDTSDTLCTSMPKFDSTDFSGLVYCMSCNVRRKKNYRELYRKIVNSDWYKQAYENKSIGDVIEIEQ